MGNAHRWQGEETNWTDWLGLFVQLLDVQLASSLGLDYWQRWGFCMDSLISSIIFHFFFQIEVIYNTLLN